MAYTEYLKNLKASKVNCKVFIDGKTMLSGRIVDFDDTCIIVNKCLVERRKLVSITPDN